MYQDPATTESQASVPFPLIRALIRQKHIVVLLATLGVLLIGWWVAFRTGLVDGYVISAILAAATYFVIRVLVEVVELVAETLMPR
ncbi:Uncharacterised protein [Bordetella ansorpii]|uniref:Uncharacterized protein n=1 Tax=Bordetella ansorpii TaxID=288768 RepID=A0A157SVJ0_9BORD|nr:hypothetical protein [Bordetella ansorpii]SAI74470.1 Uncharacterised protein [Bordetella ansorpii]